MTNITDDELIQAAAQKLRSRNLGDLYVADVGCALIGADDKVYTGACVGGSLSVCAEQSAVSSMVSHTDPKIKKIVAVWRDEHGELYVVPPCGRCREFLRIVSGDNVETEVILGKDHVVKLKELLPYHMWHAEKA
jgi:cytidine deaminase